jgi:dienelactone hydrolase
MKALVAFFLALPLCFAACAQEEAPSTASEVLAKDLREEIVRTQATVKDMYGRQETMPVPMTVYRPEGDGPFPLVVFNHGRAVSAKRASQGRYRPEAVARYLVAKGFVVLVPNRIGYWQTYGSFDPEYSACGPIEQMSMAASDQVLATVEFAKTLPYVDASRWLVAGQSVGGLTTVATVGRAPAGLLGGINFSGGTGGDPDARPGRPCNPAATARYWGEIAKNAKVPMLWMYWENDKYWGPDIPKTWHKAWVEGGAQATFAGFGPSGSNGHSGLTEDMDHWLPVVDEFLARLGFDRPAIVKPPQATAFAAIDAVDAVPVRPSNKAAYGKFLDMAMPRAFAVSTQGGFGFANGDYAVGRALGNCQRYGKPCALYAVDADVVWKPQ